MFDAVPPPVENEETFLARRAEEERRRMAESACLVRASHEEFAEAYEERLEQAAAVTRSLETLVGKLR